MAEVDGSWLSPIQQREVVEGNDVTPPATVFFPYGGDIVAFEQRAGDTMEGSTRRYSIQIEMQPGDNGDIGRTMRKARIIPGDLSEEKNPPVLPKPRDYSKPWHDDPRVIKL